MSRWKHPPEHTFFRKLVRFAVRLIGGRNGEWGVTFAILSVALCRSTASNGGIDGLAFLENPKRRWYFVTVVTIASEKHAENTVDRSMNEPSSQENVSEKTVNLLSPREENRIVAHMFRRQVVTAMRQTLATARFRLFTILFYSALLWLFLFVLSCGGFEFLQSVLESMSLYQTLIRALIGLFFVVILVMLSFSTAILLHGFLFRSPDVLLLLTLPLREERVFLAKMDQTQLLAGWAFMLAGSAILTAFGVMDKVDGYYYPYMLAILAVYTQICTASGAILCWLLLRFLPLRRIPWVFGVAILLSLAYIFVRFLLPFSQSTSEDMANMQWVQDIFGRFRGFENRFLPSWWATAGLLRATLGNVRESLPFLGLLFIHALFLRMIAAMLAARWYRLVFGAGITRQVSDSEELRGTRAANLSCSTDPVANESCGCAMSFDQAEPFDRATTVGAKSAASTANAITTDAECTDVACDGSVSGQGRGGEDFYPAAHSRLRRLGMAVDRGFAKLLVGFGPDTRAMMLKDWKLFRREPGQWGQLAIALGLVGMYLVNVRRMNFEIHAESWTHFIGLMNLLVVGLLLGTSATRLIYPLVSQEGSHFWTLAQLPIHRDRLLLAKFCFSVVGMWVPAALLVLIGDLLFRTSFELGWLHQAISLAYATGLSGIAVGLGASYPDLREVSSSKVASGFGGTLNLVLGASYVILLVFSVAIPAHMNVLVHESHLFSGNAVEWLILWYRAGIGVAVTLAIVASVAPMRVGMKRFRNAEF